MSRKSTLLLLTAALLAALAYLIARPSSPPAAGGAASPPVPVARDADAPDLDAEDLRASTEQRTTLANDAPEPENADPAADETTDPLDVLVLSRSTGKPVASVEIVCVRATPGLVVPNVEVGRHLGEIVRLIEPASKRYLSGEDGRARVPWPEGRTFLVGRTKSAFGVTQIDRVSRPPVVLELHDDAPITVQVVDEKGTPRAGVPVALRARQATRIDDVATEITTGEDGLATFPHGLAARTHNETARVAVAIAGAFDPPIEETLDAERVSAAPIQLVLPEYGEAEVWLKRRDGSVWTEEAEVGLISIANANEDARMNMPFRKDTGARVKTRGGRAMFEYVSIGGVLEAAAVRAGLGTERRVEGRGPMAAGDRATLILTLDADPDMPTLQARAVDERGAPIVSTELVARRVVGETAPAMSWFTRVRTDEDGVFQIEIYWDPPQEGRTGFLLARAAEEFVRGECGRIQAPLELTPGVHELGDVVIAPGPLLAAGTVVRSDGTPIAHASVTLLVHQGKRFALAMHANTVTDASGRFELRGCFDATRVRLLVQGPGLGLTTLEADPGTSGLRVVLSPSGSIAGSVIVGGLVRPRDLFVIASIPGEAPDQSGGPRLVVPRADGSFAMEGLAEGTYRIEIKARGTDPVAFAVDGVRVAPGETTADERLQGIDLSKRLFACELTVLAPDGKPLATEVNVSWKASDSAVEVRGGRWSPSGSAKIVSPHEFLDATVDVDGFRRAHPERISGRRDVRMTPGLPVRVVLRGDVRAPEPPFFLQPVLVWREDENVDCGWSSRPFDAEGSTRVLAPLPGKYEVNVGVGRGRIFRGSVWVDIDPPRIVEIDDVPGEQQIEVRLDKAALEKALKSYGAD